MGQIGSKKTGENLGRSAEFCVGRWVRADPRDIQRPGHAFAPLMAGEAFALAQLIRDYQRYSRRATKPSNVIVSSTLTKLVLWTACTQTGVVTALNHADI